MSEFRYTPRSVGTIKLHARTMAPETIAAIMRCPVSTVELICRKHGIEMLGEDYVPPPPPEDDRLLKRKRVEISVDALSFVGLVNEARRRGLAPVDLIRQVVEAVARDGLYAAVLEK